MWERITKKDFKSEMEKTNYIHNHAREFYELLVKVEDEIENSNKKEQENK